MVRLKWQHIDVQGVQGGGGPSISFPQNYISEMDTFSCINSQFMDDAWSLKSLRPGLQMLL